MARRIGGDLSIGDLERILKVRRGKLGRLEKRRAKVLKQLAVLNATIGSMGGEARGAVGRVRNAVSLAESIATVLKKAGGPMKVSDIMDAVQATGYRTSSDNFRSIVNQALIKDKRFGKGEVRGSYLLKK